MFYNKTAGVILQAALFMVNNTQVDKSSSENLLEVPQVEVGKEGCFEDFGCFSLDWPWTDPINRPIAQYPQSPDLVDPIYCLYTRNNPRFPKDCQRLRHNDTENLYRSFLVPTHRTYFISHGFLDSGFKPWVRVMTEKLLNKSDCNVISIGWQGGSSPPYAQAVANIRLVGAMTAKLINHLHKTLGVRTEYIHVIGHSLGSHIAGYIGNMLNTTYGLKLGRITGMDPAEPHFSQTDPVVRLDPTDALFVDIIHTDARPFIEGGLGIDEPIGHLDFYPNGGSNQPGCNHTIVTKDNGSFVEAVRKFLGCDHVRSYVYFIESIDSKCPFLSVECDSYESFVAGKCFKCRSPLNPEGLTCAKMGLDSIKAVQNDVSPSSKEYTKLFTVTGSHSPFCKSLYRIQLEISDSTASREHKGEIGMWALELDGIKGRTHRFPVFKEKTYLAGSVHVDVVGASQVGRVRWAKLFWHHRTTINFLTWRLFPSKNYVKRLIVENLEEDSRAELCPNIDDGLVYSGYTLDLRPCSDSINELK